MARKSEEEMAAAVQAMMAAGGEPAADQFRDAHMAAEDLLQMVLWDVPDRRRSERATVAALKVPTVVPVDDTDPYVYPGMEMMLDATVGALGVLWWDDDQPDLGAVARLVDARLGAAGLMFYAASLRWILADLDGNDHAHIAGWLLERDLPVLDVEGSRGWEAAATEHHRSMPGMADLLAHVHRVIDDAITPQMRDRYETEIAEIERRLRGDTP